MRSPSSILLIALVSLLLLGAFSRSSPAQANDCDPGLNQVTDGPYGYRQRGDRCEGIYIRKVQASSLQVVSFSESVEDFDPAANQNLLVQWASPTQTNVHVRAYSLRHRLYYRMDSQRPSGATSFTWPPNMLAALNLRKNELGVVAWISHRLGSETPDVYLPVRLTQRALPKRSNRYRLVIVPGVELAEVFVSLATVDLNGNLGAYIKRAEPLGWGFYPAERAITIDTPQMTTRGIYQLEIGATRKDGGAATTRVWFHHAP